ncbi:MAG: T9SS type A sorting domain-containing protein, partial [Flavobacterium sp.]
NNKIINNTVYDFSQQLHIENFPIFSIRNTFISNNNFVAKTTSQTALYIHLYNDDSPSNFGTFSNNVYARPIDDNKTISINQEYPGRSILSNVALDSWKQIYHVDLQSSSSPKKITDLGDLQLKFNATHSPNTFWLNETFQDLSGHVYNNILALNSFSSVVLIKDTNFTLPTLQSDNFQGKATENKIELMWSISSPLSDLTFEIEKSTDGINFYTIDHIHTNNQGLIYHSTDSNPINGMNIYRIKFPDEYGKLKYSKMIVIPFNRMTLNLFPNPASNYINIDIGKNNKPGKTTLSIKNVNGQTVMVTEYKATISHKSIDITNLAQGTYLITLNNNN